MRIKEFDQRRQTRRKVHGIAAALLPYERAGRIAVEAFQRHLVATHHAGLMNAVNMDTGYVNYLSDSEKQDVLRWAREALGQKVPFVAGAYIVNRARDVVNLYRQQIDAIVGFGGYTDPVPERAPAWSVGEGQGRDLPSGEPGISPRAGI